MASIKFQRVLALPAPEDIEASTIYLVAGEDADQLEIYASSSDGQVVRHALTKSEVEDMIADGTIASSEKGQADGVATLDSSGLVPSSQLPSYVDDVIEVANEAALPEEGETSKIYVTLDQNKIFRWSGSVYINIPAGVGTSDSATKLATARSISITGDATWTTSFDGTANVSAALTLASVGTAGAQGGIVTTDAKGRVVSSRALVAGDLPSEITSDTTGNAATATEALNVTLAMQEW